MNANFTLIKPYGVAQRIKATRCATPGCAFASCVSDTYFYKNAKLFYISNTINLFQHWGSRNGPVDMIHDLGCGTRHTRVRIPVRTGKIRCSSPLNPPTKHL